jgi:hypothetical protein
LKYRVNLNGKRVSITVSESALKQLKKSTKPLLLEVELYFSCLIKKVCHFRESEDIDDYVMVIDGLYVHFRATMTNRCSIEEFDKDKPADFPIVDQKPYIPNWVSLDLLATTGPGILATRSKLLTRMLSMGFVCYKTV